MNGHALRSSEAGYWSSPSKIFLYENVLVEAEKSDSATGSAHFVQSFVVCVAASFNANSLTVLLAVSVIGNQKYFLHNSSMNLLQVVSCGIALARLIVIDVLCVATTLSSVS